MSAGVKYPQPAHRLTRLMPWQKHDPSEVKHLPEHSAAVTNSTTVFPTTIITPEESPRLLISGINSRKIGKRVTKGRWKTLPIYTLTLVERETCPDNCSNWLSCYGNNMHFARRHRATEALQPKLDAEIAQLAWRHPRGFVVRLHVLGGFYGTEYTMFWAFQLLKHPHLRLFGFTAHHSKSEIGRRIDFMNRQFAGRCLIRFSLGKTPDPAAPHTAETVWVKPEHPTQHNAGTICPAQTERTDCCGTCTLCWNPAAKHIVFIGHGRKARATNQEKPL